MAQQQLEAYRLGRQLIPALPDNLAAQFGTWVVNYVRDNPNQVANIAREATTWIQQNAPQLGRQAWHLTQAMQERATQLFYNPPDPQWFDAGGIILSGGDTGRTIEMGTDSQGNLPDLQDLIPENTRSNTRRINSGEMSNVPSSNSNTGKRPPEGPPPGQPEATALRTSNNATNPVSKETPVSPYDNLPYGMQETHTTLLPWNGWVSAIGMDTATPVVLELRLTQPHDIIATGMNNTALGSAWTKGINVHPFNNASSRAGAETEFPSVSVVNSTAERAHWFTFWAKFYEYYTVLKCHWEIVIDNPNTTNFSDLLVGWDYNSYTDTTVS